MNSSFFYSLLKKQFPFTPTIKQDLFFQQIAEFCTNIDNNEIFVLKGYAGTGKTTVISTIVNNLSEINKKYVLLAPTGRAAKVIANYSHKPAYTIHKKIYFPKKVAGGVSFTMQQNKHKNTFFIVDEASMISDSNTDSNAFEKGSLLDDLISYVYSGTNCKMILLGDTAQLPPVNLDISPALNIDTLGMHYNKEIKHIEFDEVMRQEEKSGILFNATELRDVLKEELYESFKFNLKGYKDIIRLTDGYDIQDAINSAYSNYSIEETAFIVRSNKRANQYNQQIRTRILDKESDLSTGDYLMVVKNNYFWLKETDEAGFIANGDITSPEKAVQVLEHTGAAAVMIGRGAQGNPWIFSQINQYLEKGERLAPPNFEELGQMMTRHLLALHKFYGEVGGVRISRKHIGWYSSELAGGREFTQQFNKLESTAHQQQFLQQFFNDPVNQEQAA